MRNKKVSRSDYSNLKRKMIQQILLILVVSAMAIFLLRNILRGQVGERIVNFLENIFLLSREEAMSIYQYIFRNNINVIIMAGLILLFVLFFAFWLSRFTKYFDEINSGIDQLIDSSERDIELSPEMAFTEKKLNTLKQTLETRERLANEAEQRKNDLVVYLAHDIKTPLTSVIGYLSLLDEIPEMPIEQRAKYTHITLEKANHLEALINEFFEITRYNLQKITLEKSTIDLYYMLVQMAAEFYPLLAPDGKKVAIHADEDLMFYGDPDKLARVFNNIFKNAISYSNHNSTIDIIVEVKESRVIMTFRNFGTPIPKEKTASIFEKFYRLDEARSTNGGGVGLGLAISKEIIMLHGGTIGVKSDQTCTDFIVELPINPKP